MEYMVNDLHISYCDDQYTLKRPNEVSGMTLSKCVSWFYTYDYKSQTHSINDSII